MINNLGGNKLDYYLSRHIDYTAGACDGPTRKTVVTVQLTNNAPAAGLPDYVAVNNEIPVDVPTGTNLSWVSLLATSKAELTKATIDGQPLTIVTGAERGHPVFNAQVAIEPGHTIELRYELTEPTTPGTPRVPIQPLLDTVTPAVSVPECPDKQRHPFGDCRPQRGRTSSRHVRPTRPPRPHGWSAAIDTTGAGQDRAAFAPIFSARSKQDFAAAANVLTAEAWPGSAGSQGCSSNGADRFLRKGSGFAHQLAANSLNGADASQVKIGCCTRSARRCRRYAATVISRMVTCPT